MTPTEATEVKPVEQPDPFHGAEPSFNEFSKFREDGTVPERAKQAADEKPKESRDKQGRFTKVLENWKEEADFARAVNDGMVTPSDDMDPDTWLAARRAQIKNGARVTMPQDPKAEST